MFFCLCRHTTKTCSNKQLQPYYSSSSNIVVEPSKQGHKLLFKMIGILSCAHNIKKFNFT